MPTLLSWLQHDLFSLIQTIGIVAGLCFTAVSLVADKRASEDATMLSLAEKHRSLWSEVSQRKDLSRILLPEVSQGSASLSLTEKEFLNVVIVHYQAGWQIAKHRGSEALRSLKADVIDFFSLPLPREAWETTKKFRDRRFVAFVERAIRNS